MNKKAYFFLPMFLLALLSITPKQSIATHSFNMEMFYRHVSDSSYEFTLIFYRNCTGFTAGAPNSVNIAASAPSISGTGTIFCNRLPTSGSGVPPLQPPNLYNCLDTALCTEEYVYRGTWTSPKRATDWNFSYQLCCWPNSPAPANIQNGTIYVEAGLNNLTFPDWKSKNLSPIFHNRRPNHPGRLTDTINNAPQFSTCAKRNVYIDQKTKEYDGDSVAYEFFIPQTIGGSASTYINSYTFANPIPSLTTPFEIDSITGGIRFTTGHPAFSGVYVLGIKATEYRNDTTVSGGSYTVAKKEIGFVKRNLVVVIEDSATCNDGNFTFAGPNGLDTNLVVFECPSQSFDIRLTDYMLCSSMDTNASNLQLRHPATNKIIPLKSAHPKDCNNDAISKRFTVTVDSLITTDTFELVFKRGNDGNTILSECFLELDAYSDTLTIVFEEQPVGVLLGDANGTGFDPSVQIDCDDSTFTVNLSAEIKCNSISPDFSDFILVDGNNNQVNIKDISPVCNTGRSVELEFTTDPIPGGLFMLKLQTGSDSNTLLNYCEVAWPKDSIYIISFPVLPNLGPDTTFCEEDSNFLITLNAGFYNSYLWSTGDATQSISVSKPGIYWVAAFNQHGCVGVDSITISSKLCYQGIDAAIDKFRVNIFPNPSKGIFNIEFANIRGDESIDVYDSQGRLHREVNKISNKNTYQIDLSDLPEGMYMIQVRLNENILAREKIILKK